MGKYLVFGVALMLLLTGRCYTADFESAMAGVPIVGAMVSPPAPVPAYVDTIGTPAATTLPEADLATWFADDAEDPYDVTTWRAIGAFVAVMGTADGFAQACKAAAEAAGGERSANPELAALACSDDGTVTQLQRFAAGVLALQSELVAWYRGAPGASLGAIEARQGEVRLMCGFDIVARQGGAESVYAEACSKALDNAYREGDVLASFEAAAEAYALVAEDIATRDPSVDQEPGYFEEPKE
ncbi:MAG: hypothetical protein IT303_09140 [Dehalococcoidia bacterium]|nr:hypothetical protein [Dehalococcoidia bacterium]